MKRVIIAVAILLSVAAVCFVSLMTESKNIHKLLDIIDDMEQSFEKKELGDCLEVTNRFVKQFDKRTRSLPFFMRHSDVSKIKEVVVTLPVMLEQDDTESYAAELARCRAMLTELSKLETPSLENIL